MTALQPKPTPAADSAHALPRLLAVASGKGGVGKTWFSIALAHTLARQGHRVLLFDGDLGLANIDVQLGLQSDCDLGRYAEGSVALHDLVTGYKAGGFDVIVGRSGVRKLAALDGKRLQTLAFELRALAAEYDTVILDLGAGIGAQVRSLAALAELQLVITTDEPTALTDAYAYIKLTRQQSAQARLAAVINMAATKREGDRTFGTLFKACQNFLRFDLKLAGIVRRDPRVREAIKAQTPSTLRSPNGVASEDVEALALNLQVPA
jgi:flagellar biosynthesis protein FlhG